MVVTPRVESTRTRVPDAASLAPPAVEGRPIVAARGVAKTHRVGTREVHALRGVDLEVAPGEMVAVMGPSGSGKTSLLNCLAGLDRIEGGEVRIAGENVHAMPDARRTAFRGRAMGFVFQAYNLVPVFTAAENVELPLLATGERPSAARRRAADVLARVGLAGRSDHHPAELSGGERQRVAIARALANGPAIVWGDEPTGALDSATAARVMRLLRDLNEEGLTVVLVTHDREVAGYADRVLTMRDGSIVREEGPR